MTIEEAIKNRENCLEYLEKSGPLATKENVQAVRLSLEALREKAEREKNAPLTREKLVELLRYADDSCVNTGCMECSHMKRGRSCKAYFYADYLLADGVTVQEWIPVSEPPKEDGRYFVARYDYVTKTPFADILWFEKGQWWNRLHGGNFAVTHWMPMPPLPKGE